MTDQQAAMFLLLFPIVSFGVFAYFADRRQRRKA